MMSRLGATSILIWIFLLMGASKAELFTLQINGRPKLSRDSSILISLCTLPVPLSCSTLQCHELGISRSPSCQTTFKKKYGSSVIIQNWNFCTQFSKNFRKSYNDDDDEMMRSHNYSSVELNT